MQNFDLKDVDYGFGYEFYLFDIFYFFFMDSYKF